MSAIILNFPCKPKAKNVKPKKLPKARPANQDVKVVIEVDRLRNYRIFGSEATRCLVSANYELHKLIERSAAGEPPTNEELEAIKLNLNYVVLSFDCADKFMLVHGHSVNKDDRFDDLYHKYSPALRHKPSMSLVEIKKVLEGISND